MILTESRLRKIIRHVLLEAGKRKRHGLGTYTREKGEIGGFGSAANPLSGQAGFNFGGDFVEGDDALEEDDQEESDQEESDY